MSTMGRAADRAAEQRRRYERSLDDKRIRLGRAIRFAIGTLTDISILDADARRMALQVLSKWSHLDEFDVLVDGIEGSLAV